MFENDDNKHRVRRVSLGYDELIKIFNWSREPAGNVIQVVAHDLPEDCEVVRVFDDPNVRGLGVLLRHESFDVVPLGHLFPCHPFPGCILLMKAMPAAEVLSKPQRRDDSVPRIVSDPPGEDSTTWFQRVMGVES